MTAPLFEHTDKHGDRLRIVRPPVGGWTLAATSRHATAEVWHGRRGGRRGGRSTGRRRAAVNVEIHDWCGRLDDSEGERCPCRAPHDVPASRRRLRDAIVRARRSDDIAARARRAAA